MVARWQVRHILGLGVWWLLEIFKNPAAAKQREEGWVEERTMDILDRRHIDVPDSVRRWVRACTDPTCSRSGCTEPTRSQTRLTSSMTKPE